ncbi:MAG: hypothetical protein AB8B62_11210 [Roseobacter sp.]
MTAIDRLLKGMSTVTTTGLSVAINANERPCAGHPLHSWMQWRGGLAIATAILTIVISPGASDRKLGNAGLDNNNLLVSTSCSAPVAD